MSCKGFKMEWSVGREHKTVRRWECELEECGEVGKWETS